MSLYLSSGEGMQAVATKLCFNLRLSRSREVSLLALHLESTLFCIKVVCCWARSVNIFGLIGFYVSKLTIVEDLNCPSTYFLWSPRVIRLFFRCYLSNYSAV